VECACGDPEAIASWVQAPVPAAAAKQGLAGLRMQIETAQRNLKRLADAGVVIAAGTDAGNIGTLHGPSMHRELELMAEAGLTPMQVLVAATRDAARVFAEEPEFGTIEAGTLADLLVLDADPLADVRNARRIRQVVKGGKVLERAALETALPSAPCNPPAR
jgi:imidazolonepropionase-like amidohydrolase